MPIPHSSSDDSSAFHTDPLLEAQQIHSPILQGPARIHGAMYAAQFAGAGIGAGRIAALLVMAHMQAPGQSYKQNIESLLSSMLHNRVRPTNLN